MLQTAVFLFKGMHLRFAGMVFAALLPFFGVPVAYAEESAKGSDSAQIMKDFNQQRIDNERAKSITEKDKHQVMFLMGVVLLVFILVTGGLGIAMGVYGKSVFVPHMIFAGLSTTLAIVHAIVGIVWFFPF